VQNLLALEQRFTYPGPPPEVGDRLVISERLDKVSTTRGSRGPMVIVRLVIAFHDPDGALRAENTCTSAFVGGAGG
jgi:hypothetical protein